MNLPIGTRLLIESSIFIIKVERFSGTSIPISNPSEIAFRVETLNSIT